MSKFPGPYVNQTVASDPMMERVPMDRMGIGANAAGLPRGGINSGGMTIKHTGANLGGKE